MVRKLRVSITALVCASVLALPLAAAEGEPPKAPADFLKPLAGPQEMGETGMRIPLTLEEKMAAADLLPEVTVLDAALGTRRELLYVTAFAPKIEGQFLIVPAPIPVLPQGTYDFKLKVQSKNDCCKKEQALDVRIVLPAAQIQAPGTLVIRREIGLFRDRVLNGTLVLRKTSGPPLSDITVDQVGWQASAQTVGNAWVDFDPPVLSRRQWLVKNIQIKHAGNLPLGTVQGLGEIWTPQLAAAVPFTFEVRSRRTASWIVFAIGLGLLCGLLLRTLLPKLTALGQARIQAIEVVANIERELGRRKDPAFQAKAKETLKALKQALSQRMANPEDLDKARTAATDALKVELDDLNGRLETARQEIDQADRLAKTRWNLPVEMTAALAKVEPGLQKAREALKGSNATAASEAVRGALDQLADLPEAIRGWINEAGSVIDGLADLPVPSNLRDGLKASADHARTLLDAIPDPGTQPESAALKAALDAVHAARGDLRRLFSRLETGLGLTLSRVGETLKAETMPDQPALDATLLEAKQAAGLLSKAVETPETAVANVMVPALEGFDRALSRGLLAQVAAGDPRKAVQTQLDRQAYGEAAREVLRQIAAAKPKVHGEGTIKGDAPETAPAAAKPPTVPGWSEIPAARWVLAEWTSAITPLDLAPGTIESTRGHIETELGWITAVRTVLVAIGLLLVGLVLFRDKVGSWNDVAEVVLWAFGIDVTVDAFWAAAKTLKKA
ncbi:MAG: hypothetical protein ACJ75H_18320 [Thermoanaerobaculia bacterium]